MNKRLIARIGVFTSVLLALLCGSISAFSPQVRDIDVNVLLAQDGSAQITQTWDVTVASGTEWYLVQDNMGDMKISNLKVIDENGTVFQDASPWDINASINEKREKSGIHTTDSGYELCWGVGSMGEHKYTVSYNMTNFVKAYSDYSGFNVRLINDKLSSPPQHIKATIARADGAPLAESTGMWAFGFGGSVYLIDGKIVAESSQSLSESNHVTIMAQFPLDVFAPTSVHTESFEALKNKALAGSDYNQSNDNKEHGSYVPETNNPEVYPNNNNFSAYRLFSIIPVMIPFVFIIAAVIIFWPRKNSSRSSRSPALRINEKSLDYCRSIPYGGNLLQSYSALKAAGKLADDNALIGAYLLRWIKAGNARVEERESKGFLGMGKKPEASIVLCSTPQATGAELELFNILLEAAGSDGILQSRELENWCKSNYQQLEGWQASSEAQGARELFANHDYEMTKVPVFFGLFSSDKTTFTETGTKNIQNALGFKKYLLDFTIINERKPAEVQLWDEYLVFANMFGIAEQVAKDFKAIYPTYFEIQPGGYNTFDTYYTLMLINRMSRAATSGLNSGHSAAMSRSAGGGGFSSFGGGGGFSGGGSGGGSR